MLSIKQSKQVSYVEQTNFTAFDKGAQLFRESIEKRILGGILAEVGEK